MLSTLEFRLAAYGVLLAVIAGWLIYERVHLIDEGEARIKAQDTQARAAQKAEDEKVSAGVVNELREKLANLPVQPRITPTLRLCNPLRVVSAVPAPSGAQPALVGPVGTSAFGVPEGTTGIDIGGDVQASERAAEVIAIYRDTTWEWAVKSTR